MDIFISWEFKCVQVPIRRKEGNISPDGVDDGARVSGGRRSIGEWRKGEKQWVDGELYYQDRETVM